jgi:hypothetical protein
MLADTDRAGDKSQGAPTRGDHSAEVSASLRHLSRVRSETANTDLAEAAGAVVVSNKRGQNIQQTQSRPRSAGDAAFPY